MSIYEIQTTTECYDKNFHAKLCYGYQFTVEEFNAVICSIANLTEEQLCGKDDSDWKNNVRTTLLKHEIDVKVYRYAYDVCVASRQGWETDASSVGNSDVNSIVIKTPLEQYDSSLEHMKKFATLFQIQHEPCWFLMSVCV